MKLEALFLIAAVAGVGVLHTIVPDHWVPIALMARQRGWSRGETARVAFRAGIGHTLSTLAIGVAVWVAGVAFAQRFGAIVDTAASLALVGFGLWIAVSSWLELRGGGHSHGNGHGHAHGHGHGHGFVPGRAPGRGVVHGPERQVIDAGHGTLILSIFGDLVPPKFRLTGPAADFVRIETVREGGGRQDFAMANRGGYWESLDAVPEPHGFVARVTLDHGGHAHTHVAAFAQQRQQPHGHDHAHEDAAAGDRLYAPMPGGVATLTHTHAHRHGRGSAHTHRHDHAADDGHAVDAAAKPLHVHAHKTSSRMALMLILGSSPMVEGIPAFFAAGKFGAGVIALMAAVFAASTIATYVALCVASAAGLRRVKLGAFERYGEVLSGAFIAAVGVAFWVFPVL